MFPCVCGENTAARSPLDETLLDHVRLDDVLDGVAGRKGRRRSSRCRTGPPPKLWRSWRDSAGRAGRGPYCRHGGVSALRRRSRDDRVGAGDFCEVAHTAQEAAGNAGGATAPDAISRTAISRAPSSVMPSPAGGHRAARSIPVPRPYRSSVAPECRNDRAAAWSASRGGWWRQRA